jgi:carboxypeptidase T
MISRAFAVAVLVVFTALSGPVHAAQQAPDELSVRVRLQSAEPGVLKAALELRGYDVLWADTAHSAVDLVASREDWRELQRQGVIGVIVDRGRPLQAAAAKAPTASLTAAATASLAAAKVLSRPGYRNLDAIVARLYEIAAAYPAIAEVVDLTTTYNTPPTFEGRHLYALKISDNVAVDEDEPAMLIVATHHAREIGTPVIALEAADRLTSGYGVDAQITAAVDGNEIWIAPVWNPDGYNHVFTTDNMWRKNRHVFPAGVGVDLNRNFAPGYSASCAGSTNVNSEIYKGPSASSEAETITMQTWSGAERFAKVIDYHSYGREVLYAYLCLNHPFEAWMQQEAAAISVASGYDGLTRVPSADGEHQQWQFARMGAYAFLIETHSEFQPAYDSAVAEAGLVWPGILAVLDRPISVQGHVTDAVTGAPLAATIELAGVTFTNGETNASGGAYGAYHMFLPPGSYNVRFSLPGYQTVVAPVTVGATSSVTLEVPMTAEDVVFADDFEIDKGWTRNPSRTDTATGGLWERGVPQTTASNGPKQLAAAAGANDLSTGRLKGDSAASNDVDGGSTSIQSPVIALPASGTLTLTFRYYFAHGSDSSSADAFRVMVLGNTQLQALVELGAATNDNAVWATATVDLTPFAGQTVRLLVSAVDGAGASMVEAAIDEVKIVRR